MAAPSNIRTLLITLLVAFAVVLQPSAAASDVVEEAFAAVVAGANGGQAPAPPPSDGGDGGILPMPPQPAECKPWLMRMMPCAGFLTNPTVYAPEPTCCAGFNSLFTYETVTCLCHVVNGDIDQLLPAPMMHMRMLELFTVCGHDVRVEIFTWACTQIEVPPIDLPSPPPSSPLPSPSPAPALSAGGWP